MMNDNLHIVHARAAGLDVHKMQITATVRLCTANDGEPVCETRTFNALASGLAELTAWLVGHRIQAAAMEATGVYWQTPWDALTDAGISAQLLHARHVKQLRGYKTDVGDSRWLARVCQFGLGRPSFVPPRLFRDLRALSHHRRKLIAQRSRVRNQAQKVLDCSGVRIGGVLSDVFGMNGRRILNALIHQKPRQDILASLSNHVSAKLDTLDDALTLSLNDIDRLILTNLLGEHDDIDRRVHNCDQQINQSLTPYKTLLDLLESIPGISRTTACAILIEIGPDISVFGNGSRFSAWSGVCPGNNESAGKRRSGRIRQGNKTIRSVLVECAHGAARTKDCQFQTYHRLLMVRRGYRRAIVAVAHKMARTIFSVLRNRRPYRDPQVNYEELLVKRNAARWLRKLEEFNVVVHHNDGTISLNWHRT